VKADRSDRPAPALRSPLTAAPVTRSAQGRRVRLQHLAQRLQPRRQAEPLEARRHLVERLAHRRVRRRGRGRAISRHGVACPSWIEHPEPTGSGRATPLPLPQHRTGHPRLRHPHPVGSSAPWAPTLGLGAESARDSWRECSPHPPSRSRRNGLTWSRRSRPRSTWRRRPGPGDGPDQRCAGAAPGDPQRRGAAAAGAGLRPGRAVAAHGRGLGRGQRAGGPVRHRGDGPGHCSGRCARRRTGSARSPARCSAARRPRRRPRARCRGAGCGSRMAA
jgi:hypothetical protein